MQDIFYWAKAFSLFYSLIFAHAKTPKICYCNQINQVFLIWVIIFFNPFIDLSAHFFLKGKLKYILFFSAQCLLCMWIFAIAWIHLQQRSKSNFLLQGICFLNDNLCVKQTLKRPILNKLPNILDSNILLPVVRQERTETSNMPLHVYLLCSIFSVWLLPQSHLQDKFKFNLCTFL